MIISYNACPVCSGKNIRHFLHVKDHAVSGRQFPIYECSDCKLRFTQNIPDQAHIGPYYRFENYVSHNNTKQGLVNRLYHIARFFSLQGKFSLLKSLVQGSTGKHLDYGAGTGAFVQMMVSKGWDSIGLEPDDLARSVAARDFGIQLQEPNYLQQIKSNSLDIITLWHVLEHVHELHATFEQLINKVKLGGHIIIAVPNYTSYDAKHYGENWAAYDVPRHLYHFSPDTIAFLANKYQLQLIQQKPMWFDAWYVAMLSEKYQQKKLGLLRACWVGCISNWKALSKNTACSSIIYVLKKPYVTVQK
ncbi:MAG: class I SAM-dependent methyltransferase [Sediminibacterium sp.]|nr:class I SAM-dependent methyltransferase [Sediminibacterium sp.]